MDEESTLSQLRRVLKSEVASASGLRRVRFDDWSTLCGETIGMQFSMQHALRDVRPLPVQLVPFEVAAAICSPHISLARCDSFFESFKPVTKAALSLCTSVKEPKQICIFVDGYRLCTGFRWHFWKEKFKLHQDPPFRSKNI